MTTKRDKTHNQLVAMFSALHNDGVISENVKDSADLLDTLLDEIANAEIAVHEEEWK